MYCNWMVSYASKCGVLFPNGRILGNPLLHDIIIIIIIGMTTSHSCPINYSPPMLANMLLLILCVPKQVSSSIIYVERDLHRRKLETEAKLRLCDTLNLMELFGWNDGTRIHNRWKAFLNIARKNDPHWHFSWAEKFPHTCTYSNHYCSACRTNKRCMPLTYSNGQKCSLLIDFRLFNFQKSHQTTIDNTWARWLSFARSYGYHILSVLLSP